MSSTLTAAPYFLVRLASCCERIQLFESRCRLSSSDYDDLSPWKTPDREAKTSTLGEANEGMTQMVNTPDCSDITFVCQDGVRVHASRMMLVSKCSVFHTMLMNGMAESRQSEISLPAITSIALHAILEFLNTGELSWEDLEVRFGEKEAESSPLWSWKGLLEAMEGARFFMLKNLERSIPQLLWNDIARGMSYKDGTLEEMASRLTLVFEIFKNITVTDTDSNAAVSDLEVITLQLVRILFSHDVTSSVLRKLSPKAFLYFFRCNQRVKCMRNILQGSQTFQEDLDEFSLKEYLRLRQLITWCCLQESESGTESDSICSFLPDPRKAKAYVKNPPVLSLKLPSILKSRPTWMKDSMKNQLLDLSMVDLTLIHPELLINIVDPLNIIPSSQIMDVLKNHSSRGSLLLHRTCIRPQADVATVVPSATWRFSTINFQRSSIKDQGNCFGIAEKEAVVLAYWSEAMWFYDDYEWEISSSHRLQTWEVGFINLSYGENFSFMRSLAMSNRGWGLRRLTGGQLWAFNPDEYCGAIDTGVNQSRRTVLGKRKNKTGTQIGVEFKRLIKTCSFFYNGREYCQHWPNLSSGTMFPAVYLTGTACTCKFSIKMTVTKGFPSIKQNLT